MNRREFLRFAGLGVGVLYTGAWLSSCGGGGMGGNPITVSKSLLYIPNDNTNLLGYMYLSDNDPFTLTARTIGYEFLSGKSTSVFAYEVNYNNRTYYNPIIVLRKEQSMNVSFSNQIGEDSIIHWHGFRADWLKDGHPYYAVGNGESYDYGSISIIDRSGTYFYHPHPHGRTGYQVYKGLAGMIVIEDTDEDNLKQALDLQYGITDIPLIIQDKTFDSNGNLVYNPMGMNGHTGFWGENVLVNWTLNPYMEVERRIYRFRILNGSNARPYRLVLLRGSQRMRFWVIGVEGGLLDKPYEVYEILIAPGERIDILVDFRDANEGDVLRLYSLQHNLVGMNGGGGGMMGGMMNLINREFEVLEFRVVRDSTYDKGIPSELSALGSVPAATKSENITLDMSGGVFTINGLTWVNQGNVSNPYNYGFNYSNGDVVEFTITNNTGMYHPMHFHGFQFRVTYRSSGGLRATDMGWKDTVIVGPGETVKVVIDMSHTFSQTQWYLLHCHILEHHDAGMMVQYSVGA